MPRPDNHGGTKDADDGWALTRDGSFSLAFDARIARHSCGTRTSSPGIEVGTNRRHEGQVLNFS